MSKYRRHTYPILLCLLAAATMLLPALQPGQLFLLDMPWPERIYIEAYTRAGISAHFPIIWLLWLLNFIIPAYLLQKILLLTIVTAAGVGMYLLQKRLNLLSTRWALGSGLMYMANPFVLDRLQAGQWLVLAGYAFLPFFARFVYEAFTSPTKRTVLVAMGGWILYPILSVHWWYMVTLILLPVCAYRLMRYIHTRPRLFRWPAHALPTKSAVKVALLLGAVLTSWFLLLAIRYTSLIRHVGTPDFEAFATHGIDALGAWGAVLTLRGFWYSGDTIPSAFEPIWITVCTALLMLTVYATVLLRRHSRAVALYTGAILVAVILLAVGYGSPASQWFADGVRHVVPGFSGMRETQKFAGLLAFAYALGAPIAAWHLLLRTKKHPAALGVIAAGLALYVLCIAFAVQALYASLHTYHYPNDWKKVDHLLVERSAKRVLVLPWNGYMHAPFAHHAYISSPARIYFKAETVRRHASGNPLLDAAEGTTPLDVQVLSLKKQGLALHDLQAAGYDYILVIHSDDFQSYTKILDNERMPKIFSGQSLTLYKINMPQQSWLLY